MWPVQIKIITISATNFSTSHRKFSLFFVARTFYVRFEGILNTDEKNPAENFSGCFKLNKF